MNKKQLKRNTEEDSNAKNTANIFYRFFIT